MKYYKLTLLKDLPNLNKGFSFVLTENQIKDPFGYIFKKPNSNSSKENEKYSEQIHTICKYMDNPEFVKVEFDLSRSIQIRCPNCEVLGMFDYEDSEQRVFDDGVYSYYKAVGLWCPHCKFHLHTHTVHTRTEVKS